MLALRYGNISRLVGLVAGIILFLSSMPSMPNEYYDLTRLLISLSALMIGCRSIIALEGISASVAFMIVIFLAYNPIIVVHLPKALWNVLDLIAAAVFLNITFNPVQVYTQGLVWKD